jgi:hypothetical protein
VTTIPGTNPASRALAEAVEALEPYAADGRYSDLIRRLEALQDAYQAERPEHDHDGDVAQAMIRADRIAKAGDLPWAIREKARKASASLQLSHLAKVNPAAARAHESRQQGV